MQYSDMWQLENTYKDKLPEHFYNNDSPSPVANAELVYFNEALAKSLEIGWLTENRDLAINVLSGNEVLKGSSPIAQAYAGHQFGNFTMLGDGRAVLLGEHLAAGQRFDIQLKGSGVTKFSRRGDGRATLPAMLREYLMSEALHHLGIPTTRSLAVVKTGNPVYRQNLNEGAVLTRVAKSHIRVGTFEYARAFGKLTGLEQLTRYTIERHYPEFLAEENLALALLKSVMDKQIDLIVDWMRVGFIHGVMNTDNMSIAGETIDYGPCAFMNTYHPDTVFSSIDTQGRYAFNNQPRIAHWNLSVLANALLPLIAEDQDKAVEKAKEVLNEFPEIYSDRFLKMMYCKLGITHTADEDRELVGELLSLLSEHQVDYTNFFISLRNETLTSDGLLQHQIISEWHQKWQTAHGRQGEQERGLAMMDSYNPKVIARNHLVEEALEEAVSGNTEPFDILLKNLSDPYGKHTNIQQVPAGFDHGYQTFCGT